MIDRSTTKTLKMICSSSLSVPVCLVLQLSVTSNLTEYSMQGKYVPSMSETEMCSRRQCVTNYALSRRTRMRSRIISSSVFSDTFCRTSIASSMPKCWLRRLGPAVTPPCIYNIYCHILCAHCTECVNQQRDVSCHCQMAQIRQVGTEGLGS